MSQDRERRIRLAEGKKDRLKLFDSHLMDSLQTIGKSDLLLSSHRKEALKSVLAERDTLVSLPTGHSKSVVFELLPHLCNAFKQHASPSAVLAISPLIVLMETQISDLRRRGPEGTCHVNFLADVL